MASQHVVLGRLPGEPVGQRATEQQQDQVADNDRQRGHESSSPGEGVSRSAGQANFTTRIQAPAVAREITRW